MNMKRTAFIAGLSALVLAFAAVAVASLGNAPRIQAADGLMHFTGTPTVTTCTGADGQQYVSLTGTYTGSMVSSRPEFNGTSTVTFQGRMNASTGVGIGTGRFQLVDG